MDSGTARRVAIIAHRASMSYDNDTRTIRLDLEINNRDYIKICITIFKQRIKSVIGEKVKVKLHSDRHLRAVLTEEQFLIWKLGGQ